MMKPANLTFLRKTFLAFLLTVLGLSVMSCGGSNSGPAVPPSVTGWNLLAGNIGGPGYSDGAGDSAEFRQPNRVAFDSSGNAYIADSGNRMIRKISAAGIVTTLTWSAGACGDIANKAGTPALFGYYLRSIAVDDSGNVIVGSESAICKISQSGVVTTLAGTPSNRGCADGTGAAAQIGYPMGLAVDSNGNVYVADEWCAAIRKVTPAGVVTTLVLTFDDASAPISGAHLYRPQGIAIDAVGNMYVADSNNNVIRKVTPDGVGITLAGAVGQMGNTDGAGSAARFKYPSGITIDNNGNIIVTDLGNYTVRKVTPDGVVSTIAGNTGLFGGRSICPRHLSGLDSQCYLEDSSQIGVAVDRSGNILLADAYGSKIIKILPAGTASIFAGSALITGSADGVGAAAQFNGPMGLAVDSSDNVYVADTGNSEIRKIAMDGTVVTLAGRAGIRGSADGKGPAAQFYGPVSVAVDADGNLIVADTTASTIRKVTPDGVVSTIAGTVGDYSSADGIGTTAKFNYLGSVAVDRSGTIYVTENSAIRKITPDGTVSTLAGKAGAYGNTDGPGATARFSYQPGGIGVDNFGNVYVADSHTIRKVSPSGVVTTLAGTRGISGSADGLGSAAQFAGLSSIAMDALGNLYVLDGPTSIRKVTPEGLVSTYVGSNTISQIQMPTQISPKGLAISSYGFVITGKNGVVALHGM